MLTSTGTITANHLRTAARLFEMRDQARGCLGLRYRQTMYEYGAAIRVQSAIRHLGNPLHVALCMVRDGGPQITESDAVCLMAAAVEMIEAGEAAA